MKRCLFLTALAALLFFSCARKPEKKPDVLLTEQQMVEVLADSYLLEAELNTRKSRGEDVKGLQRTYYDQLFEHYGITDSIFDQNMRYYTYTPAVLERIMDSVTRRLEKVQ